MHPGINVSPRHRTIHYMTITEILSAVAVAVGRVGRDDLAEDVRRLTARYERVMDRR